MGIDRLHGGSLHGRRYGRRYPTISFGAGSLVHPTYTPSYVPLLLWRYLSDLAQSLQVRTSSGARTVWSQSGVIELPPCSALEKVSHQGIERAKFLLVSLIDATTRLEAKKR